ncbi:sugar ABC transporter ATP-binding protein [Corynebacterium sp. 13CS0277]|uniref:ABC transporter ATP-binding protein n=1 Tax=Corynebacterium sp. 13CS0277 TaxID=2071994 RepID=UPI000D033E8C|nr:sn-glycerol-3-phosphate ABC transporter ATP-binding protein UgpC [Corynebacterium sp. 13CS0277]PRQ10798.1 sugar ABC transporter ATP-binding protein [Corynebacterium sp. 13CS0277]
MARITFEDVSIRYPGADAPTVTGLNLDIADGEFLVLVGPSGCGKSTSLRALAGLENVSSGRILIDGEDVTGQEPAERDVAMVFQNYALYPHMTVAKNMGFALKLAGIDKHTIDLKVREAADILGLTPYLERRPKDLSGGQRQRVAMGRAIVRNPRVFLMDEPLSNLDAKLRVQTRTELAALQRRLGTTTVYVTHDQVEAMTMGDRVAVLKDGVLQQVASPRELYDRPANAFVAGFIGSPAMNLLRATHPSAGEVILGIRPEDVDVATTAPAGAAGAPAAGNSAEVLEIAATVDLVEELGAESYIYAHRADAPEVILTARTPREATPQVGSQVTLRAPFARCHFFDPTTEERIEV